MIGLWRSVRRLLAHDTLPAPGRFRARLVLDIAVPHDRRAEAANALSAFAEKHARLVERSVVRAVEAGFVIELCLLLADVGRVELVAADLARHLARHGIDCHQAFS